MAERPPQWEVSAAEMGSAALDALLHNRWEPFASYYRHACGGRKGTAVVVVRRPRAERFGK